MFTRNGEEVVENKFCPLHRFHAVPGAGFGRLRDGRSAPTNVERLAYRHSLQRPWT